jgi:hypothetical protein
MPRKITYFSAELARPAGGKEAFPAKTIPPARNNAALYDQPHGCVPVADVEKLFVGRKAPWRTARKAKCELYLSWS